MCVCLHVENKYWIIKTFRSSALTHPLVQTNQFNLAIYLTKDITELSSVQSLLFSNGSFKVQRSPRGNAASDLHMTLIPNIPSSLEFQNHPKSISHSNNESIRNYLVLKNRSIFLGGGGGSIPFNIDVINIGYVFIIYTILSFLYNCLIIIYIFCLLILFSDVLKNVSFFLCPYNEIQ